MKKELNPATIFLITILALALLSSLTSCRGTKTVYKCNGKWSKMDKTSAMTGLTYKN